MRIKAQNWGAIVAVAVSLLVLVHMAGIVRRDLQSDRVLKTYSEVLKPGMKRSEVEAYLTSKHVSFSQGNYPFRSDLVKIAEEQKGWVCTDQFVYVAFEFGGTISLADPEDRLIGTSIERSVCLDLP